MAAGQGALAVAADVAALDALELELAVGEAERGAQHAATLRRVLRMNAVYASSGNGFSTTSHVALALGCSENRAAKLLAEALGLAELPGGLEAVECGLLTVEQAATAVAQFAPLPLALRLKVWRRLQARLCEQGVLPPARLTDLLRDWIIAADKDAAEQRRRQAEAGRRLEYRRRDDGLWDLFALGFRGPDMQAVLSRIAERSQRVSLHDDRSADQRRLDAMKDLLLGREALPLEQAPAAEVPGAAACGCLPGSPAPCGAEMLVHLRWEAGLGMTDEPAHLVGHGPIEHDLLQDLLLAGPRLRAVWTDEHGVPIAIDTASVQVPRGDPHALRQALLDLARRPPPPRRPRTPDDHDPGPPGAARDEATAAPHPLDQPGPYRPPRGIRRLVKARAPLCEWPGCGARAERCDDEHDLAWPLGPTCPCNLGPCCRHHHRVKQRGWTKSRRLDGSVLWTGPTGRSWLSAAQHRPPLPATRPLTPVPTTNEWDQLSPSEVDDELWALDLIADDDLTNHRAPVDQDPPDSDRVGRRIESGDTSWSLDLDDPYRWLAEELASVV